jgi:glutathione S-transferase
MGALILWGLMDSPFVRRVAVALCHYRMDWERRPLSVFRDFTALQRVSPLGRAPVLALANGRLLADSRSILEWLDEEVAPELRLTPADDGLRLDMLEIEAVALGAAEKAVEHSGERLRRAVPDVSRIGRLEAQLGAALDWLDAQAGATPLVGDRLSRADLALGCLATYMAEKSPRLWGARRRLIAYRAWAEAQPAFLAAPFSLAEARAAGWRAKGEEGA